MTKQPQYLILSIYWTPTAGEQLVGETPCMWWRPDEQGYTRDVDQAGRYPLVKAQRICDGTDRAFYLPEEEVEAAVERTAVVPVHKLGTKLQGAILKMAKAIE